MVDLILAGCGKTFIDANGTLSSVDFPYLYPGDAGEGAGMGRVTAAAELAAELAAIPIMHPGKGAKIRISGEDPFGPPNQREPCADLIRGHPFITFAKFLGFWTHPLVRSFTQLISTVVRKIGHFSW